MILYLPEKQKFFSGKVNQRREVGRIWKRGFGEMEGKGMKNNPDPLKLYFGVCPI
jgi:hypothetical protein